MAVASKLAGFTVGQTSAMSSGCCSRTSSIKPRKSRAKRPPGSQEPGARSQERGARRGWPCTDCTLTEQGPGGNSWLLAPGSWLLAIQLSQLEALRLARRRLGELFHELHPPRPLVLRDSLAHERLQLLRQGV